MQFYSNRNAAELSWKSYKRCRTLTKEEEKVVNKRAELLSKKKLPAIRDIQKLREATTRYIPMWMSEIRDWRTSWKASKGKELLGMMVSCICFCVFKI